MLLDLRYAFRTVRRSPGFAAAILLLFTACIGASIAVFSVLHGVLLRSLPYEDPEQLVRVRLTSPSGVRGPISVLDYLDLAAGMRSATPVGLVSHRFWTERLGSNPQAVGQVIAFDGADLNVIGVMPARFEFR